jgi:hypothetical protein
MHVSIGYSKLEVWANTIIFYEQFHNSTQSSSALMALSCFDLALRRLC